jgi:hypothetical protein
MPESRVGVFLGVDIGITVLALAVVVLRVGYRWSRRQLAVSDYLVSTAMVRQVSSVWRYRIGKRRSL